ncbi:MAG: HD domain-containing protein [Lachnospiraceae bacterium]|nr:HD domain-containing protein [Lachnospiraceae bacterium]
MTYQEILKNEEVKALIDRGNANLRVLGFTDHSQAHCALVAERAAYILEQFGYSEHDRELAKIAGFMHDIGNAVNRTRHAEYGAILANDILKNTDMTLQDRMTIMSAIGNHDESTGGAKDAISAALIIADKTDVRRNRVSEKDKTKFDIHDQVNYAVTKSDITIDMEKLVITLNLEIDENICTMYEYFDIFLERMMMSRGAAEMLGAKFNLRVNGGRVL